MMLRNAIAIVLGLTVSAASARAAFMDDFNSYDVGDTLEEANNAYSSKSYIKIFQDFTDAVNSSKVVRMSASGSDGATISGATKFNHITSNLSGDVQASVDILPTAATGSHHGVLFWDSDVAGVDGYAAWVQFNEGGSILARGAPNRTIAESYDPTHWYRLAFAMHLKSDGTQSTYDVTVIDLSNDNALVGEAIGVNSYGDPTQVNGGEFDASAKGAGGTTITLDGRYDNLSLGNVPEPGSLGLLLGGLLMMRRRK